MAKRRLKWTQKKYDEFMINRNWEKQQHEYIPFLNIHSFSSSGRVSRVKSKTCNRVHHFFSDIQARYFYILDWIQYVDYNDRQAEIIDIREHYPLFDLEDTDHRNLSLEKFIDKESKVPYIITTTFLITLKVDDEIFYIARSVKSKSSLEKAISIEKLEIERQFWKSKNIDFKLVLSNNLQVLPATS